MSVNYRNINKFILNGDNATLTIGRCPQFVFHFFVRLRPKLEKETYVR